MENKILEFIKRRFKKDCDWTDGNCYYFALILKNRFPDGKIYNDVIYGHFVFKYQNSFYDWNGYYEKANSNLIEWDNFRYYDSLQEDRIIRNCIL